MRESGRQEGKFADRRLPIDAPIPITRRRLFHDRRVRFASQTTRRCEPLCVPAPYPPDFPNPAPAPGPKWEQRAWALRLVDPRLVAQLPHRLLLRDGEHAPPARSWLPDVHAHVHHAARVRHDIERRRARRRPRRAPGALITSTTLNRRGSPGLGLRGAGCRRRRLDTTAGAGPGRRAPCSTFSSGTISAPVPFVPVSSTHVLRLRSLISAIRD